MEGSRCIIEDQNDFFYIIPAIFNGDNSLHRYFFFTLQKTVGLGCT